MLGEEKVSRQGVMYYENIDGVIVGKSCIGCKNVKKIENFTRDKKGLGGTISKCRECVARIKRIKSGSTADGYGTRVTLEVKDGVTGKTCTNCNAWKSLTDYHTHKLGQGGRDSVCRECRAEYYDENKESYAERGRIYHKNNPEMCVIKAHRRRARMISLPDDFTSEQMRATLEYFGGCVLTGDTSDIHWDHAIPIATGHGGTTFGNMIPLRSDLNLSKHDGNIFEWYNRSKNRFNLSQVKFDRLIAWLAEQNEMTADDYRAYVYACFENKREEAI